MKRSSILATVLVAVAACGGSIPSAATTGPVAAAPATPASASIAPTAAGATATPADASPTSGPPAASPAPLKLLWDASGPVSANTSTVSSAIDPVTGNLWVAVPFENRYWILSPGGKYLESWGAAGSGPGQFDFSDHGQNPDGWGAIAFAPDGSFFVGDTGNHRVEAFDAKRRFVRQWGTFGSGDGQFVQIVSLATDGTTVFVGDGTRYDTQAFKTDGTFLRSFGSDEGMDTIAVDAKRRVHATNPQAPAGAAMSMAIFGADGTEVSRTDLTAFGGWPVSVSVDTAGDSFVCVELGQFPFTNLALVEIGPDGKVLRSWAGAGGDVATVTPRGDAFYATRGIQLDGTQWTTVRKYAIPAP
jgi:hypothetical protein